MNPLVIAWVVVSGFGLILSAYLTAESWRDIVALATEHGANGRRWAALSRFLREGLRVTVHWAWLLLGVSALLDIRLGTMVVVGLLYGNGVLVVNSLVDARTRSLIYRHRGTDRPETPIQKEDREVGDTRRELQAKNRDD